MTLLTAWLLPPASSAAGSAFADNAYSNHLAEVRKAAPPGFTVLAQPPFVVIGDGPAESVARYSVQTVKWAVDMLKQDYFPRDPAHHALIMDISTGGGTLVHEMVHAFMTPNFSNCPAWFNEGLASLYEQSEMRDGHIHGLINWRYPALAQAIREGKVISLRQLTATTDNEFYGGGGSNYSQYYAQARYLCYYLQEKGLLVKFYREFNARAKEDPTGYATLQRVLGESDMAAFQKRWEEFILGLPPP